VIADQHGRGRRHGKKRGVPHQGAVANTPVVMRGGQSGGGRAAKFFLFVFFFDGFNRRGDEWRESGG